MDLTGPCNWPAASCPECDDDCGSLSAAQRADMEAWAISDLWEATGRVYGTCTTTIYPCYESTCGTCRSTGCGCAWVSEVSIPGPVADITEVVVDGVTLDAADYIVQRDQYGGYWLVRVDGGSWPTNTDPTDPDAFSVTYLHGTEPPAGAGIMVGKLVCSRSACATTGCRVPKNTTQVSRQGVTMVRGGGATSSRPWRYETDTMSVFGILDVDQWIRNAQYPTLAGAVHSPDLPTVRRTTWAATP